MALHSFWDVNVVDKRGRKHTLTTHAVGLEPEAEVIKNHLQTNVLRNVQSIEVKPAEGLINFHGYPVHALPSSGVPAVNDAGDQVNTTTGAILGPDGKPIQQISDDLMVVKVNHPNPPGKSAADLQQVPLDKTPATEGVAQTIGNVQSDANEPVEVGVGK
jgi:hypothetical protein